MGINQLPTELSTLSTEKPLTTYTYPQLSTNNRCVILKLMGISLIRIKRGVGDMKLILAGTNMDLTEDLKEMTQRKMDKLDKYFDDTITGDVTFSRQGEREKIEVTIQLPGHILRVEEESYDIYESLDDAVEVLEKQIRKYTGKLRDRYRHGDTIRFDSIPSPDEDDESDEINIVRTKRFDLTPMTAEEAVLQMELLNHDFFIFMDGDTGTTQVVYKRRNGDYGLIIPKG